MPGGHSHTHAHGHLHGTGHGDSDAKPVRIGILARLGLTVFLGVALAGTLFGLVRYWPDGSAGDHKVAASDFAAPGVTFPVGEVWRVLPACTYPTGGGANGSDNPGGTTPGDQGPGADGSGGSAPTCGAITVNLDASASTGDRPSVTVPVPPAISSSGLQAGDRVQLMRIPAQSGNPESYSFLQVQRGAPLAILLAIFVVVVGIVARWRGLLALVGLGVGGAIVGLFMLPALLDGRSGLVVALVGSSAIMFVVLYLAHGLSMRTSTALAGTLFGVGITAGLGVAAVHLARLSGVSNDEAATLSSFVDTLSLRELLTCAIIVAGLGVLNDVTITQSSSVWELRAAAPHLGRREIFRSGMRIGRDHIASTIYTIVFAYAGAALPVLLLIFLYERPVLDMLQTESMSEEIVRTLASAIGLVLAVPATTAIAALTVGGARDDEPAPSSDEPEDPEPGERDDPYEDSRYEDSRYEDSRYEGARHDDPYETQHVPAAVGAPTAPMPAQPSREPEHSGHSGPARPAGQAGPWTAALPGNGTQDDVPMTRAQARADSRGRRPLGQVPRSR